MANLNNIDGVISTTNSQILAAGLNIPPNFNNSRSPNELQTLINYNGNTSKIYNKYGFKTIPKNQQPSNPSIIGNTKQYFQQAANDLILIKNFTFSNAGLNFTLRQTFLQGLNSFNETKLYNPAMPILGTTANASFGLQDAPIRFIEPNLGGVFGALGLSSVSSLFGIGATPTPPKGTVGGTALPNTATDGGKGLIRGITATNANKNFQTKWGNSGTSGFSISGLISSAGNFLKTNSLFGALLPIGQPNNPDGSNVQYKVGEQTYGIFYNDIKTVQANQNSSNFLQSVSSGLGGFGSATGISSVASGLSNFLSNNSTALSKIYSGEANPFIQKYTSGKQVGGKGVNYSSIVKSSGISDSSNENSPLKTKLTGSYTNTIYPSNFNDNNDSSIKFVNNQLKNLLKDIPTGKNNFTYNLNVSNYVATSYKELSGIKNQGEQYPDKYSGTNGVVSYAKSNVNNISLLTKKGLDTNQPDSINLKDIISGSSDYFGANSLYPSLGYNDIYSPYADDTIAFYFHDIVNNKYIPFRATIRGIQESLQSEWNDVKYINRADKIYTYGGFGRTLTFNFSIVITSIKELLPTWKRINYLAGLTKPANYTEGTVYSRFAIPPLVKFTIGDVYKEQPAVITQIGITIPDEASWETLSEVKANRDDYQYLNGKITLPNSKNKYAQFPNQCEISINMNLLEKEMARTGGSNFGDYYLDKDFKAIGSSGKNSFSANIYTNQVNSNLTQEEVKNLAYFGQKTNPYE
jgi:hypothetical protein